MKVEGMWTTAVHGHASKANILAVGVATVDLPYHHHIQLFTTAHITASHVSIRLATLQDVRLREYNTRQTIFSTSPGGYVTFVSVQPMARQRNFFAKVRAEGS